MADYVEVMKIQSRMCKKKRYCTRCPMGSENNGKGYGCGDFSRIYPEQAQEILLKWAEENPFKTKWDKLIEIFGEEMAVTLKISPDDWHKWCQEYKGPEVRNEED